MPTEAELRALLRGEDDDSPRLDADRIIRRARARRRPKQLAVGALSGLAAVAVVVPVTLGLGAMRPMSASDGAAAPLSNSESAAGQSAFEDGARGGSLATDPAPECSRGATQPETTAVPSGVELTLTQATAGGAITFTLVNGSDVALHGDVAGVPDIALSTGDLPVGWSTAAVGAVRVDLAAGESMRLDVPLAAVSCTGGPLPAGGYGAEALLAIRLDTGEVVGATNLRTRIEVG
ncbi:MAG: hypothetical protein J0H23_12615 [Micrococcales bacterium]|nr:hypothetical protein [Micrococcales bacterium]OJX69232.1 MAG: hypothetical protein BGO94_11820 [Micrococcales bacterium 72-143]